MECEQRSRSGTAMVLGVTEEARRDIRAHKKLKTILSGRTVRTVSDFDV
jgi:hypothetical protein